MIQIGNVVLEHPVFLAAGCVKYPQDARKILASPSSAVLVGSLTKTPYGEDSGDVFWFDGSKSTTYFGLPNPGIEAWREELRLLAEEGKKIGKPLIVNVAAESIEDYLDIAEQAFGSGASAVELNLTWPALPSRRGKQKYTFSDDPKAVAELLRQAWLRLRGGNLWLKFAPLQGLILEEMVKAINEHGDPMVNAVVCCGPLPRTLIFDEEGEPVVGRDGLGRLGGDFLRPIALGQVKQFRELLPATVAVIGLGGVSTRDHVNEYLRAGASAVGLTTAYHIAGEDIFTYLLHQDTPEQSSTL